MEANYVGPGWYWVEGVEQPLFLVMKDGLTSARVYVNGMGLCDSNHFKGEPFKIIAHIPRPITRPVVDWSVMPAWAKWVCATYWGSWRWASAKPTLEDRYWAITDGYGGEIPKEHEPKYTGDWKNSLVGRPE